MGQGHSHGDQGHANAGHDHTAGANARSLSIALAITGAFLVAELVGAYWFNSLALLSDAAHMFTDAAALGIALLAIKIGQRPADEKRTYGYRRFEILARFCTDEQEVEKSDQVFTGCVGVSDLKFTVHPSTCLRLASSRACSSPCTAAAA